MTIISPNLFTPLPPVAVSDNLLNEMWSYLIEPTAFEQEKHDTAGGDE